MRGGAARREREQSGGTLGAERIYPSTSDNRLTGAEVKDAEARD